MNKVYVYKSCDGCRRAMKWLESKGLSLETVAIRDTPPSVAELTVARASMGSLQKLFNVSGRDYRELDLKSKLPSLREEEAYEMLAANGNLVKRPFLATARGCWAGFDEAAWSQLLGA